MTIFAGIISAIAASTTKKDKPQLTFTLTVDGEDLNAVVYTEDRIALFADFKDGDEVLIAANVSTGRYAPAGTLVVSQLNPDLPTPVDFYTGPGIEAKALVVLTAGAYARKSVAGIATAAVDISAADINEAHALAAEKGISWQEVMIENEMLVSQDFVELHGTRAYVEGDTKAGLHHYAEDRAAAVEHMRKVGVKGYAAALREEAAENTDAAPAEAAEAAEAA